MTPLHFYLCASFLAPALFIADTVNTHREYYATVVELTNSPVFRLLCMNTFVAFTIVMWHTTRWLFFGKLNNEETDAVHRVLPLYLSECIVGPYFFNASILSTVGAASLLTVIVRLLHKLAEERVTTLPIVEDRRQRQRMLRGLFSFLMILMPLDLYVVFDVWAIGSTNHEKVSGLRYSVALLYMQFVITNVQCLVRMFFSISSADSVKTPLTFYVETLIDLFRCIIFFVSFSYVSVVSQVPFPLVRLLFHNVAIFLGKLNRLIRYWQLTQFVSRIQNASAEDLSRDPRCPICHDDMSPQDQCKRLPCGHCYHEPCLRRCFETKSSCPYCGTDLLSHMQRPRPPLPQTQRTQQAQRTQHAPQRPLQQQTKQQREEKEEKAAAAATVGSSEANEDVDLVDDMEVSRAYAQYCERAWHARVRLTPVNRLSPRAFHDNEGAAAQIGGQSREQRRLAAYRIYEETIRAASDALEAQLKAIDAQGS